MTSATEDPLMKDVFKVFPERDSHLEYLESRNWSIVENFWSSMMTTKTLPSFINGFESHEYGVTDLNRIHNIGLSQYASDNPRYKRQTFALRIGYQGTKYQGYQCQKDPDVRTVEEELTYILKCKVCCAGRTDRDVSAISQIVDFHTYDDITAQDIITRIQESEPAKQGRLRIYDCVRVPKKFHSQFSATWRRYIFLFPLQGEDIQRQLQQSDNSCKRKKTEDGRVNMGDKQYDNNIDFDVDVDLSLPYNGFAFREDRESEDGSGDVCTLHVARAFRVNLSTATVTVTVTAAETEAEIGVKGVEAIEGLSVAQNHPSGGTSDSASAICIELIGTRFLRRMVRILVATAIREAILPEHERDEDVLLKICETRCRNRASSALPGIGLCMSGVGYNIDDLAVDRFTATNPKKIAKNLAKLQKKLEKQSGQETVVSGADTSPLPKDHTTVLIHPVDMVLTETNLGTIQPEPEFGDLIDQSLKLNNPRRVMLILKTIEHNLNNAMPLKSGASAAEYKSEAI
eukprot:gene7398-15105_t